VGNLLLSENVFPFQRMAQRPITLSAVIEGGPEPVALLPPSAYPLNLLLHWPDEGSRPQWLRIFGTSLGLHVVLFFLALQIPSFVSPELPERRVAQHRIKLYLPPDVMTQRAPNRHEVSKQIDLADLMSSQPEPAHRAAPSPSVRRFELPRNSVLPAKTAPQILPQAPDVATSEPTGPLPPGSPTGLTAPPAPKPATESPFQDIGTEAPPSAHPKLAPPKATVQAAINGLTEKANGGHVIISDDRQSEPMPLSPGSLNRSGAQHTAIELKSDPQGADFRAYLAQILSIVRANWKHVIPESARMGTLRGRTVVEFIIARDGSIPKLVVGDPSGSDPLDRAAIAGLSMSNPLPPLPADFKGQQIRLAFSFAYNMPAE
jgi:TonB family protein